MKVTVYMQDYRKSPILPRFLHNTKCHIGYDISTICSAAASDCPVAKCDP